MNRDDQLTPARPKPRRVVVRAKPAGGSCGRLEVIGDSRADSPDIEAVINRVILSAVHGIGRRSVDVGRHDRLLHIRIVTPEPAGHLASAERLIRLVDAFLKHRPNRHSPTARTWRRTRVASRVPLEPKVEEQVGPGRRTHPLAAVRAMTSRPPAAGTLLRWFLSAAAKIHRLRQPPSVRLVTERTGSRARRPASRLPGQTRPVSHAYRTNGSFCIADCLDHRRQARADTRILHVRCRIRV